MITTGCNGCCFLHKQNEQYGCLLGNMCSVQDGDVTAQGYCRMCRSKKWVKKQDSANLQNLYDEVIKECSLKFDMLVCFNENENCIQDLEYTLALDKNIEYINKIIIVDTTGFGDRQNLALQYIKENKCSVPIVVDSSVLHESTDDRDKTIQRISKKVESDLFFVIPAGKKINNFDILSRKRCLTNSRVVHWSFPFLIGNTSVIHNKLDYGLFITQAYKTLTYNNPGKTFTEIIKQEEIDTKMLLSWFCEDVCLI